MRRKGRHNLMLILISFNLIMVIVVFFVLDFHQKKYDVVDTVTTNYVTVVSSNLIGAATVDSLVTEKTVEPYVVSLNGTYSGRPAVASCNYSYMTGRAGIPLLMVSDGFYLRRGSVTRWGRILWIGFDYFLTDTTMVHLGSGKNNNGGKRSSLLGKGLVKNEF